MTMMLAFIRRVVEVIVIGLIAVASFGAVQDPRDRRIAVDPGWDLHVLGQSLMTRDHLEDAIRVFEINVREHLGSSRAYEDLGTALVRLGHRSTAAFVLQRALELDPSASGAATLLQQLQAEAPGGR